MSRSANREAAVSAKRWSLVGLLTVLAVAGCTLNKSALRQDGLVTRIGGKGQLIEPKRCALQVAILTRPVDDPALDSGVWNGTDEQVVAPELLTALERNGLRIGLITGSLPAEIESILNAPPPKRIEPSQIILPDGEHTLISLGNATSTASLLLCRDGNAFGKDYADASGWLRVTATQEGTSGVALRFVPEVHFGPIQHTYGAAPTGGLYAPQNFMIKDGQAEETFRDLAATLTLQPGQVAVIGGRRQLPRSLGGFLFTQPEINSDRLVQKLVLIWASRSSQDLPPLEPVEPPDMPHPETSRGKDKVQDQDHTSAKKNDKERAQTKPGSSGTNSGA